LRGLGLAKTKPRKLKRAPLNSLQAWEFFRETKMPNLQAAH
jgi:hypothetical protein